MLVYVLKQNGQPFMPTARFGKVRRLLKTKKAKVVRREDKNSHSWLKKGKR